MFLKVRHMGPVSEEFVRITEKGRQHSLNTYQRKVQFHHTSHHSFSQDFRKLDCSDRYSKMRLTTLTMNSKFSIPYLVKPRAVLKFLLHC